MMGGEEKVRVARTTELEFGGVAGASLMVLGLPVGVYALTKWCSKDSCSLSELPKVPTSLASLRYLYDQQALQIFLAWFIFQIALSLLPIGKVVEGLPLKTGERLKYRCNGFFAFVVSLVGFAVLVYKGYPVTLGYTKFIQLATAATLFSFTLSVGLYWKAQRGPNHALAGGGNTGVFIYDFFIGHELNPRIGPLDLKFICELRPGLIGWVILDLCFLAQAYEWYGHIPPALVLVAGFHTLYVADALWYEEAILTTMDIVHDGFGFMLVFGDLVWVPFLYSLQARFLLEHPQEWSYAALTAFFVMNMIGYTVFRGSNSQKNLFRKNPRDPKVSFLETLNTASGRKLLVSGWWGICRHPNYLGDLIMATAWSLPCGNHIIPYFYPMYFLGLLVHRFERDEVSCRKKYGADWEKYKKRVPYKIFPYIY